MPGTQAAGKTDVTLCCLLVTLLVLGGLGVLAAPGPGAGAVSGETWGSGRGMSRPGGWGAVFQACSGCWLLSHPHGTVRLVLSHVQPRNQHIT